MYKRLKVNDPDSQMNTILRKESDRIELNFAKKH